MSGARFTVDLEWAYHAVRSPSEWWKWPNQVFLVKRLLDVLKRYEVKVTFYVLGDIADKHPGLVQRISYEGHLLGNHGYWHQHGEQEGDTSYYEAAQAICAALNRRDFVSYPYRSPFWDSTPRPGWAGGKAFRLLPKHLLKWEIERQGVFWIHPHDLRSLPEWDVWGEPWHRHLLLWNPWERLEWLLENIQWR